MFRNSLKRLFSSSLRDNKRPIFEAHAEFIAVLRNHRKGQGSVTMTKRIPNGFNSNIAEIVVDNSSKKGAMSANMMLELGVIVDELESQQDEIGGIVLRGKGKSFCAGLDLDLAKTAINTPQRGVLMSDYMTDCLNRIRDSNSISVCVINGPAIGGGSELVSCTDYRIMVSTTKIQSVHAQIGASPGWGGAARLYDIIGRRHSLRCLGASAVLNAEAATAIGLVDEMIPEAMEEESDATYSAAAVAFLTPFLSKKQYSKSVAGIKYMLSALDPSERATREQEVFFNRWFCEDNVEAIARATAPKAMK